MIVDLHSHTFPKSSCSALDPPELIKQAKALGIDAVCLTEHNLMWPKELVDKLAADHGFRVFRGMEVTTGIGHVLVFGLESPGSYWDVRRLRRAVDTAGGAMIFAHPLRGSHETVRGIGEDELPQLFDAMEVLNGSESVLHNTATLAISRRLGISGVGGSDAHFLREVGLCATIFDDEIRTEEELVEALKSNCYRPQRLRERESP